MVNDGIDRLPAGWVVLNAIRRVFWAAALLLGFTYAWMQAASLLAGQLPAAWEGRICR
ncbi:MAG: hypothetical protein R3E95_03345 [Thiolinea sp.]